MCYNSRNNNSALYKNLSKGEIRVFKEELTAIREAEEQSEAIKKNVKTDVKRMIEAAKAEAERILDEEETKAKEIYDSLIQEGMNEADTEYEAAIEKAHIDADNMVRAAEARKDKVIDHIVERIVRSGVNS